MATEFENVRDRFGFDGVSWELTNLGSDNLGHIPNDVKCAIQFIAKTR
jgi:hypothetical protein